MIKDQGMIVSIENYGKSILIEKDLRIGVPVLLHPGPVILVQDGDIPKLNKNMYVALAAVKNALEQGATQIDIQKLLQFVNKTLTEIESDPDLVKQVKE